MRFWLQAEEISSNVTYKFFANNKELSGADVRYTLVLKTDVVRGEMENMTFWLQAEHIVYVAISKATKPHSQ